MRVLLTGGSGFVAAHCVETLLRRGHSVVFTVRSTEKGDKILHNHSGTPKSKLSYVIVKDIAVENAFDEAVKSDPPFEGVLHTASPFHFNIVDPKKDFLDPAILGTTGILKSLKKHAPSVRRVVLTSSFASIFQANAGPNHVYSEKDWNSVTWEEALNNRSQVYRGSKTFAERAAWDFVENEKPNFTLATIMPPLVLGPIVSYLNDLDSINTSSKTTLRLLKGEFKDGPISEDRSMWVDVRDVADAHVLALETDDAQGKRFFVVGGYYSNADIARIIRDGFPEYKDRLPGDLGEEKADDGRRGYDVSRSKEVLGLEYRPLKGAIVDLVKSLKDAGA
jgi:nucleoside-diphosphate-sugar epimerase